MQRALPHFHITNFGQSIKNRKSREIFAYEIREMELKENNLGGLLVAIQKKLGGLSEMRKELGFSEREV